MATRREIADTLKLAAASYFLKKGYSCTLEIAIQKRGKRKVDVLGLTLKGTLVVGEVKSCVADFTTDHKQGKWKTYLSSCNQFYWIFTEHTTRLLEHYFSELKESGCGVLTLDSNTGYLRCTVPAKYRPMAGADRRHIITRLAWRAGEHSKRTGRRKRYFIAT